MKFLFSVIASFVCLMFIVGCEGASSMSIKEPGATVVIEREEDFWNPGLQIDCESAVLKYEERQVVITGVKHIGSSKNQLGWVATVEIIDNKLVLSIPLDADYIVYIGGVKHTFNVAQ